MTEFLKHPLTILLVGTLLTGILVPWVASAHQRRRTAFQLKIQLVQELSRAVASYQAALQALITSRHLEDGQDRHMERWDTANAAAREWLVEAAAMRSVLDAHFGRGDLSAYLGYLSVFLNESFSMAYFVIDPRNDRQHASSSYGRLISAADRLGVDVTNLPKQVDDYLHMSEVESLIGTMWAPLADAGSAASSTLATMVLNNPIVWLERGGIAGWLRLRLVHRFPRGPYC